MSPDLRPYFFAASFTLNACGAPLLRQNPESHQTSTPLPPISKQPSIDVYACVATLETKNGLCDNMDIPAPPSFPITLSCGDDIFTTLRTDIKGHTPEVSLPPSCLSAESVSVSFPPAKALIIDGQTVPACPVVGIETKERNKKRIHIEIGPCLNGSVGQLRNPSIGYRHTSHKRPEYFGRS